MQQNIWIQNFVQGAVLVLRHHAKASKAERARPFYCFKCLKAKMSFNYLGKY